MLTGYKTLIFSSLVVILGAVQSLDWAALLPNDPQEQGLVVVAIGFMISIFRVFSNTTVGTATSPAPMPIVH